MTNGLDPPAPTPEVLTLLGRIDERTRNLAENAIETRATINDIQKTIAGLDSKFGTRREMNLLKWILGIVLGLVGSGTIALLVYALSHR